MRRRRRCDADTFSGEPAVPLCRSQIHYILANPVYAGLIRHKSQVHERQHPALIDRAMWDKVQAMLASGAGRVRGVGASSPGPSPLAGKLFDETGDRLTPSHANKTGRRYRYYVSSRLVTRKSVESRPQSSGGWRLPAKALEGQLARTVIAHLRSQAAGGLMIKASIDDLRRLEDALDSLTAGVSRATNAPILNCINCAMIAPGKIEVSLDRERAAGLLSVEPETLDPAALRLETPFQFRKRGVESKLVIGDGQGKQTDATLIRNIAKAHQYYDAINRGVPFEEIADSENLSKRRILQLIDLAFLAPDIAKSIIQGDQPIGLTAKWLGQNPLPADWESQRRIVSAL